MLLLTPGTQHTICWLTPRRLIEEIRYSISPMSAQFLCPSAHLRHIVLSTNDHNVLLWRSAQETIRSIKAYVPIAHKSRGARPIFAGCLFFEIGRSSADFLDLEPCHKVSHGASDGRRRETVRPPFDFIWKWPTFGRCPDDVPATIVRQPSGDRRSSCRSPPDANESCNHRQVTVWSPFGHRRIRSGFNFDIDF